MIRVSCTLVGTGEMPGRVSGVLSALWGGKSVRCCLTSSSHCFYSAITITNACVTCEVKYTVA